MAIKAVKLVIADNQGAKRVVSVIRKLASESGLNLNIRERSTQDSLILNVKALPNAANYEKFYNTRDLNKRGENRHYIQATVEFWKKVFALPYMTIREDLCKPYTQKQLTSYGGGFAVLSISNK